MYNQLLLDIQKRKPGSYKVLLDDTWFSDLLTNYCYRYGKSEDVKNTVITDLWICICDLYKPREDGDDEYAKKFLKNRLFYRIKDINISHARYYKNHSEMKEIIDYSSSFSEEDIFSLECKIRSSHLPSLEKVTLVLKFCYKWKIEEIAELLNKSVSFVQYLLRKSLNDR
jgi:DNA-directed RNA polymerase specialized sigma24 family protein